MLRHEAEESRHIIYRAKKFVENNNVKLVQKIEISDYCNFRFHLGKDFWVRQ